MVTSEDRISRIINDETANVSNNSMLLKCNTEPACGVSTFKLHRYVNVSQGDYWFGCITLC